MDLYRCPFQSFIGEESTNSKVNFSDNPTWILDPVDGTTNFVHTFPFCAISIALYVNKQVRDLVFWNPVDTLFKISSIWIHQAQIGVVYNPIRDECFSAIAGQGAYLNGKAISSSGNKGESKSYSLTPKFG